MVVRMVAIKRLTIPSADKDAEQLELSHSAGGNKKWCSHLGKQFSSSLKKLNIKLSCDPAIPFINILPQIQKIYAHINICK